MKKMLQESIAIWTNLIFSPTLEEKIFDNFLLKRVLNMAKG